MKQKLNYQRAADVLLSLMNEHNRRPNYFVVTQIEAYTAALEDLGFEIVVDVSETKYRTIFIKHGTYSLYYTFQ